MLYGVGYIIGLIIGGTIWIVGFGKILEWLITLVARLAGEQEITRKEKAPKRKKTARIIMAVLLGVSLIFSWIIGGQ